MNEARSARFDDVVEAVLWWEAPAGPVPQRTILAVKHVKEGQTLALGERGDFLLPPEVLGTECFELVSRDGSGASLTVPPGAKLRLDGWARDERALEIERGHVVEILVGSFVVQLARASIERPARAWGSGGASLDELRSRGAGFVFGSALLHAAVFAAVALIAPSLGATEEDSFDPDRMALLKRMLDASAERERQQVQAEPQPTSEGGSTNGGEPAQGAEGAAGKPATTSNGRYAVRGTAKPEEATLPRDRMLTEAASFGAISMLTSLAPSDPSAPVVPWGTVLNGSDAESKMGHLFGGSIDDAMGTGLGVQGPDQGGGGPSNSIGINGFGPLGHAGSCAGPGPCDGIGHDHGRGLARAHVPGMKGPRYGTPVTNGRLAPEIIQRIVRQNDGRYRFCYQNALRTDPDLQGRVTVKFMIDRTGAVGFAADGGSDIPDEGVRRCVVSSFLGLSFPQPDNGTVTVVYPIVFNPE